MNWQQKIEAQITALDNLEPESDRDYMHDCAQDSIPMLQALLDVAVAADKFIHEPAGSLDEINAGMYEIDEALNKLREVGDA